MSEFQFKNVLSNDNNIFYDISKHTDYFVTHPIKEAVYLAEYVRTIARYFVQNMNKELSKTFQFEKDILDWLAIDFTSSYVRYVSKVEESSSIVDLETKDETLRCDVQNETTLEFNIGFKVKLNKVPKKVLKQLSEVFEQHREVAKNIVIECPTTCRIIYQKEAYKGLQHYHNITVEFEMIEDGVLTVSMKN
mgnify:CR=1 FL=1